MLFSNLLRWTAHAARTACGLAQRARSAAIASSMMVGAACAWGATSSYHIGNSLTWDSHPVSFAALARTQGFEHQTAHHIRCSAALNEIVLDSQTTCMGPLDPYNRYDHALPNFEWTAVTFQPHPHPPWRSTIGTDVESILYFIDLARQHPANDQTTYYLFTAWPSWWDYINQWDRDVVDSLDTWTVQRREYFDLLLGYLHQATDARVGIIPTGEVIYQLGLRIQAGEMPGFDEIEDLYRDGGHLSLDVGRYVAAATVYSTLFGLEPHSLAKPDGYFGDAAAFTDEIYAVVHDVIWEVVTNHPHAIRMTPPADFDRDGDVHFADLAVWESSFAADHRADAHRDGLSAGDDLLAWQRTVRTAAETPPQTATVPEPACLGLLGGLSLVGRRRPRLRRLGR
jgi:hypothetical protein